MKPERTSAEDLRRLTVRSCSCFLALSLLLSSAACARTRTRSAEERSAGLFARVCAGCHGVDGRGTARAGLRTRPRDLSDPKLYESMTDEQLTRVIHEGKGQMPAFGRALTPSDIDDLVRHLHTLKAR
jgi:ubiquinol-cytochrome c reductase cytochrome b subunit